MLHHPIEELGDGESIGVVHQHEPHGLQAVPAPDSAAPGADRAIAEEYLEPAHAAELAVHDVSGSLEDHPGRGEIDRPARKRSTVKVSADRDVDPCSR